ncbi:MAG: hypothetical protein GY906_11515 [bacterium]|nr:hypothetical protein [bacterium]
MMTELLTQYTSGAACARHGRSSSFPIRLEGPSRGRSVANPTTALLSTMRDRETKHRVSGYDFTHLPDVPGPAPFGG